MREVSMWFWWYGMLGIIPMFLLGLGTWDRMTSAATWGRTAHTQQP